MVNKAKKKPVIIEFIQYNGNSNKDEICKWVGKDLKTEVISDSAYEAGMGAPFFSIFIPTLEGEMRADPYDYIIKGANGEFYPCKPDIFEKTYDVISKCETCNEATVKQIGKKTDDEIAKEYAICRTYPKFETNYVANFVIREVEGAFLAGLNVYKPKWHKVADGDLPTEKKEYICKIFYYESEETFNGFLWFDPNTKEFKLLEDIEENVESTFQVKEWCEIPKE